MRKKLFSCQNFVIQFTEPDLIRQMVDFTDLLIKMEANIMGLIETWVDNFVGKSAILWAAIRRIRRFTISDEQFLFLLVLNFVMMTLGVLYV